MSLRKPTVLLTGAAGIVGRALIEEISADYEIVCLRHNNHVADPRVREFKGDLQHPTLGLSTVDFERLAARVDHVVHAAAATNWRLPPELIRETNVGGTRTILDFAAYAEAPMLYVSTAFVANPLVASEGRFIGARAYIDSKIESEQLTRESTAQTVIVRPSVVIGDSRDGRMAGFQGFHRIAGLIARGKIPLIPCAENALTDTVPQDVLASAIGGLIRNQVTSGEYWLAAGAASMTAGDIVDAAVRLGERAGSNPIRPRFMPAEAVDRLLLPLMADVLDTKLRQVFNEMLEMTWLFQLPEALPSSAVALGFGSQMTRESLRSTFEKSMTHWGQRKGLLPRPDSVVDTEVAS